MPTNKPRAMNGVQEAGGSNPLTQTTKSPENTAFSGLFHFWKMSKKGVKWRSTNNITNNIC